MILIPSLVGGGAERALVNVLKNVNYNRYRITLAVVSYVGVYTKQIPKEVRVIPLFKNALWVRVQAVLQKRVGFSLFFRRKVQSCLTDVYDVSISYLDSNFTDLLFFLKNPGKRISWVHASYKTYNNFGKYYANPNYREKLISSRYNKLDGIVFVSDDAKQEFIELFGTFKCMKVIYNHLDTGNLLAKAEAFVPKRKPNTIRFIAMGSLLPVKSYDLLVRAASLLKKEHDQFEIIVLGEGFLKKNLLKLTKELGLEEHINFMGFQSNPYPYLKTADVFIMTSISEALPVALSEAMYLGKPTLVTDCSGCRELVNYGEYGMMAEKSSESIAAKMKSYIEDPDQLRTYSEKSNTRASIFSDDEIMNKYNSILEGDLS